MGKVKKKYSAESTAKYEEWEKQNQTQRRVLDALGRRQCWEALPERDVLLNKGWPRARTKERTIRLANQRIIDRLQAELEKQGGKRPRAVAQPEAAPKVEETATKRRCGCDGGTAKGTSVEAGRKRPRAVAQPVAASKVNPPATKRRHDRGTAKHSSVDAGSSVQPSSCTAVPLKSGCRRPCMTKALRAGLRKLAGDVARERLIDHPEDLAILAEGANPPQVELDFNTKVSVMFSDVAPEAKTAPQGRSRICAACFDGKSAIGAGCPDDSACTGCKACIGRRFTCPRCHVRFTRRYVYESGSGKSSVARDPDNFEVRECPRVLHDALQRVNSKAGLAATSVVLVFYLGSSFCMPCRLGLHGRCEATKRGAKKCGSVLGGHRDRGGGGNSQSVASNRTVNVGDRRQLSMELRFETPKGIKSPTATDEEHDITDFDLRPGLDFELHPTDEIHLPRLLKDGQVRTGAFYHSMSTQLPPDHISGGFVCRRVTVVRDVNLQTNMVIMTPSEKAKYHERRKLWHKQDNSSADAYGAARRAWQEVAAQYGVEVRALFERALLRWEASEV